MKFGKANAMIGAASLALGMVSQATGKIYGAGPIRRMIQQHGKNYRDTGSIAQGNRHGGEHKHARVIARRKRQFQAKCCAQAERYEKKHGPYVPNAPIYGLSRRGNITEISV